jgi:hypothetical protein
MRDRFFASAIGLVVAFGMTTMAFGSGIQNGGVGGSSVGGLHSGYRSSGGGYGSSRAKNFSGIRGYSSWRQGSWGARRSVGGYN